MKRIAMNDLQKMAALSLAAGMSCAMPPRPLGRKTAVDRKVTYHQLSKHSWVCSIMQFGRTKRGKGTTRQAAYTAAFKKGDSDG